MPSIGHTPFPAKKTNVLNVVVVFVVVVFVVVVFVVFNIASVAVAEPGLTNQQLTLSAASYSIKSRWA